MTIKSGLFYLLEFMGKKNHYLPFIYSNCIHKTFSYSCQPLHHNCLLRFQFCYVLLAEMAAVLDYYQ